MAQLCLVRPRDRYSDLSLSHCHPRMLAGRRVVLQLGSVLTRQLVQLASPLCVAHRRRYRSCMLASHSSRHVVLPALGAIDLCSAHCSRCVHGSISGASLLSILAAFLCARDRGIHSPVDRCHRRYVLSAAGARLFRNAKGLANR